MSRFRIPSAHEDAARAAAEHHGRLTKPAGSLGALERIPPRLAALQGTPFPASRPAAALLFAADHPVCRHGVSAYPSEVTAAMVQSFLAGGAAASVLSAELALDLEVIDVGVAHPYEAPAGDGRVRLVRVADAIAGVVGDLRHDDAMSEATLEACLAAGREAVDRLPAGTRLLVLGEMGIGNTTVAAAVAAALLGVRAEEIVGAGTGVEGERYANKLRVVEDAVARARGQDPLEVLRRVGGREVAALVGAAGRAIERSMAVLVDGFIVSTAMLALVRLEPRARQGLLFGHRSREKGHRLVLEALDADPLLDLGLALGEGSGALLALPLVDLACSLHRSMATFASAGVPEKSP